MMKHYTIVQQVRLPTVGSCEGTYADLPSRTIWFKLEISGPVAGGGLPLPWWAWLSSSSSLFVESRSFHGFAGGAFGAIPFKFTAGIIVAYAKSRHAQKMNVRRDNGFRMANMELITRFMPFFFRDFCRRVYAEEDNRLGYSTSRGRRPATLLDPNDPLLPQNPKSFGTIYRLDLSLLPTRPNIQRQCRTQREFSRFFSKRCPYKLEKRILIRSKRLTHRRAAFSAAACD
jgi:hypothetical protein